MNILPREFIDRIWHGWLRWPYRLAVPVDRGKGQAIVLLHGIANNHTTWQYVLPLISKKARIIALDLLGFGHSPKPKTINYTIDDHARAVIATLRRRRVKRAVLVGHSMGALVAIEVAKRRPDIVGQLLLCGIPIYQFDDTKRRLLPNQEAIYIKLYEQLAEKQTMTLKIAEQLRHLRPGQAPFDLHQDNFHAFQKSLRNTILQQTAYTDIQNLTMPVYFLSGRLDLLVVRRYHRTLAKAIAEGGYQALAGPHDIGPRTSRVIAKAINAALEGKSLSLRRQPERAGGLTREAAMTEKR